MPFGRRKDIERYRFICTIGVDASYHNVKKNRGKTGPPRHGVPVAVWSALDLIPKQRPPVIATIVLPKSQNEFFTPLAVEIECGSIATAGRHRLANPKF